MKNYIQKYICKSVALFVGTSLMLTGCSESFLDPDPQTMFEPETVFSTENGIKSVLAICDRQLKRNYVSEDSREMIALPTEYTFSDLMESTRTMDELPTVPINIMSASRTIMDRSMPVSGRPKRAPDKATGKIIMTMTGMIKDSNWAARIK